MTSRPTGPTELEAVRDQLTRTRRLLLRLQTLLFVVLALAALAVPVVLEQSESEAPSQGRSLVTATIWLHGDEVVGWLLALAPPVVWLVVGRALADEVGDRSLTLTPTAGLLIPSLAAICLLIGVRAEVGPDGPAG